eukprot:1631515-Rhodomonas_salina.2
MVSKVGSTRVPAGAGSGWAGGTTTALLGAEPAGGRRHEDQWRARPVLCGTRAATPLTAEPIAGLGSRHMQRKTQVCYPFPLREAPAATLRRQLHQQ